MSQNDPAITPGESVMSESVRVVASCDAQLNNDTLRQMRDSLFRLYAEAVRQCMSEEPAGRVAARVLNNESATSSEVFDAFINLHRVLRERKAS